MNGGPERSGNRSVRVNAAGEPGNSIAAVKTGPTVAAEMSSNVTAKMGITAQKDLTLRKWLDVA